MVCQKATIGKGSLIIWLRLLLLLGPWLRCFNSWDIRKRLHKWFLCFSLWFKTYDHSLSFFLVLYSPSQWFNLSYLVKHRQMIMQEFIHLSEYLFKFLDSQSGTYNLLIIKNGLTILLIRMVWNSQLLLKDLLFMKFGHSGI